MEEAIIPYNRYTKQTSVSHYETNCSREQTRKRISSFINSLFKYIMYVVSCTDAPIIGPQTICRKEPTQLIDEIIEMCNIYDLNSDSFSQINSVEYSEKNKILCVHVSLLSRNNHGQKFYIFRVDRDTCNQLVTYINGFLLVNEGRILKKTDVNFSSKEA